MSREVTMKKQLLTSALVALLLTLSAVSQADDTDIYIANDIRQATTAPLVMFSLDYRANLTSTLCNDSSVGAGCAQADYFRSLTTGVAADVPSSGKFYFFDLLRLALEEALIELKS